MHKEIVANFQSIGDEVAAEHGTSKKKALVNFQVNSRKTEDEIRFIQPDRLLEMPLREVNGSGKFCTLNTKPSLNVGALRIGFVKQHGADKFEG